MHKRITPRVILPRSYRHTMPFKRPAPVPAHSSSQSRAGSSSSVLPPAKQLKLSTPETLPTVRPYIVQAKLDASAISELFSLAERHTHGVCRNAKDANVILTAVSMRRRLERHVPWDVAVSHLLLMSRIGLIMTS